MAELTGGAERVDLDEGYALIAPGLQGTAERIGPLVGVRDVTDSGVSFDDLLRRNDMQTVSTVRIDAAEVPVPASTTVRDARGEDALVLETPDLGESNGQVVLAIDEAGVMSWHFPEDGGRIQPPAVRGAGGRKRFVIRRSVPPKEVTQHRSLIGTIGSKILKVIIYPIADALLKAPAMAVAEFWEKKNRQYLLRDFCPENYKVSAINDVALPALSGAGLDRIAGGRALLFIHGFSSTAPSAFGELPPEFMQEMSKRYSGRVFAFNHFTLAHGPQKNAEMFLEAIKPMTANALDLDIVCHSRGGLVARTLANGKTLFGLDLGRVKVNRIVFVASPNNGTALADADHMVDFVDRISNILNLFVSGTAAEIMDGILAVIKIIGHGALMGLEGVLSMNPHGPFMELLNKSSAQEAQYFAIAANFDASGYSIRSLISRAGDKFVDRIFDEVANDLVVPEPGVYDKNGSEGFPIDPDHRLLFPASAGITHTSFFKHTEVADKIAQWLAP
jgi:hypothetical protein